MYHMKYTTLNDNIDTVDKNLEYYNNHRLKKLNLKIKY